MPLAGSRGESKTPMKILVLIFVSFVSGMMGVFTALASPTFGALLARAALATASRMAAPVALITAGLISFVVSGLAECTENPKWKGIWDRVKLAWKIYATALLALVVFTTGVAVTNILTSR